MKSLKPEATCSINAEAIRSFADVTGDHNPLHVDPEIAVQHGLSACIVPGAMLTIHMEKYVRSLQAQPVAILIKDCSCWSSVIRGRIILFILLSRKLVILKDLSVACLELTKQGI